MNAVINRVHHQSRVDAPIEHAFEFACTVDRQHEWNPYLEYFRVSGPLDAVGTRFDAILDLLGQSTSFEGTVSEVEAPHLIGFHLRAEHGYADWRFRFESAGHGTLLTIEVDYEKEGLVAGVVDRVVYHGALERAVRHITENFAALASIGTPVSA